MLLLKTVQRTTVIEKGKIGKALKEEKSVENINKNPQI